MAKTPLKNPGVHFPPPLLFIAGMLGGWAIQQFQPAPVSTILPAPVRVLTGWAIVVAGVGILAWALLTFWKIRTGIYPNQPANQIVAHGPFRFSRNPMYVAMTALTIGVSLLSNIGWILVVIPFILFALTVLVIRREEAYLTDAFGESYTHYCARVRRWI